MITNKIAFKNMQTVFSQYRPVYSSDVIMMKSQGIATHVMLKNSYNKTKL